MFLAGSAHVVGHRAELDRINVFPVPDGDTGTNLALTLQAMAQAVRPHREASVTAMARRLAHAGIRAARGNSGMMMSHLFLGFADGLGGMRRADAADVAGALEHAVEGLYTSVDEPVEGTLLTVARECAAEAIRCSDDVADLAVLARRLHDAARESLARTPDLLPVLREARVVDAGAKGLVRFLEGVVALIEGRTGDLAEVFAELPEPAEVVAAASSGDGARSYRYCAEYLVRGDPLPQRAQLASAVRSLGDSLIVTRASDIAKIHIHTDEPDRVESALGAAGAHVEPSKVQDMWEQQNRRRRGKKPLGILTDSTCDLPPETLIEAGITVVPLMISFGDETFVDHVDISHEEFLSRLTDPDEPHPTTSQPAPADFMRAFRCAAEEAESLLGIFLSGALSGTFGQARAAAAQFDGAPILALDSRTASLGLGFQVLLAAELAREGTETREIVAALERARERSGMFFTLETLKYVQRSGRLGKARAFVGELLGLRPILSLDSSGMLEPVDRVREADAVLPRVVELLRERIPNTRTGLRLGIAHVMCPAIAEEVRARLEQVFAPDQVLVRPATAVIAAHTGPGAWGVFYQYR